ncbi:MAG TPA: alanine dehydrogenase, partial [Solirubrobacterales bacterium]|nr:alanine dehydrogenase [Solirubrobacterales bacterium]
AQGARVADSAAAVFGETELIVKVKEPQPQEVELLEPHHVLFTYLHLAADLRLTEALCSSRATCIGYETVEDSNGRLPLLAPMSEIAGKIATQAGAFMLEKPLGGRGILLGGVPGVPAATVMIIGGGVVGQNAAFIAIGMEADVFVYDRNIDRLRELDVAFGGRGVLLGGVPGVAAATVMVIGGGVVGMNAAFIAIGMEADVFVYDRSLDRLRELEVDFGGRCSTVYSTTLAIEEMLPNADLVIGAVLVHGARAPYVIRREQLALMKPGAVLVDVAIDQGGCFETSRPTTHREPTFEVDGITHYCVANMPGAVPITSTHALTNATLPYALALADHGVAEAIRRDPGLRLGVNVAGGEVTHPAVAEGVGMEYVPVEDALGLEPTLKG